MDRGNVVNLKKEILRSLRSGTTASSLSVPSQSVLSAHHKSKNRTMLAVGYSRSKDSNYQLELRVKSNKGKAYEAAQKIKNDVGGDEVNIKILRKLTNPPPVTNSEDSENVCNVFCQRTNNLCIGLSVGHLNGKSGTIGGFAVDEDSDTTYLLSCNHVLALCNAAESGDNIYHPGPDDVRPVRDLMVAKLSPFFYDLRLNANNQGDAAFAEVLEDVQVAGNVIPALINHENQEDIGKSIKPFCRQYPTIGAKVRKYGRTTGLTYGKVEAVSLDGVEVEYGLPNGKKIIYTFDNVIQIVSENNFPFSSHGDSGSLVIEEKNSDFHGLGIVFAGGEVAEDVKKSSFEHATLCCALKDIMKINKDLTWME